MPDNFDMDDQFDWRGLARYISGESSPAERAEIEDLLERNGPLRDLVHVLERMWSRKTKPSDTPDVNESWGRMKRRMDAEAGIPSAPNSSGRLSARSDIRRLVPAADRLPQRAGDEQRRTIRKSRIGGWAGRAAALAVVGVLAVAVVNLSTSDRSSEPVAQMREVTTDPAQRATFTLGDGTQIVLNAASRLRVPDSFEDDIREVFVEGEAHFEVAHDPERPFVVHANRGRIEVLGTTFAVRKYRDDAYTQVVVAEGRVAVALEERTSGESVILRPGQRARLQEDGRLTTDRVDAAKYTSWVEGRLIFDETALDEVAKTLERWYDIEVSIEDDELYSRTLTADLKGKYLRDVLNVLAVTAPFSYELEDDRLVLRK